MLGDILQPGLRAVFCGTAVGTRSAQVGHYYAGPGNEFWPLLHRSGLTPRLLRPEQDRDLLTYGLGLTDLVKGRSASSDALLGAKDYDVQGFIERLELVRPRWIAFNGKTAAKEVARTLGRRNVELGAQDWRVGDSSVFVLPSTSAANRRRAYGGRPDRLSWFKELADLVGPHAM